MGYRIAVSEEDINEVLNQVSDQLDQGGSRWPGMTYEEGVQNALLWVTGQFDANPMED